ncbi:DUF3658 domain-containing protein [Piscinibacter gummiphilus]|uniref:DUF3658 domain-containing protein n=1 Tax=Piscinibacter gummiphilus TaxID=946333 RepID=A0ABZ0CPP5_9BURK|nr:DUF3658 domain-containing protein [Piscinibacter gummiphilus]WOB06854.1 DUF3658 domain-containing protein [Piscinibacter gummiphilus]WOB06955.1 DUF3658 domain-containing protein [Piscinibacter gummiphilus]
MNRTVAEELYGACERVLANLTECEAAIRKIEDTEERQALLKALSSAIMEVLAGVRAPVVRQFPELQPHEATGRPDTELDEEDLAAISQLPEADIAAIDVALLAECATSWRKVARVVGSAMKSLQEKLDDIPDGYYARRVVALAAAGKIESDGNLHYMRSSEVRLPQGQQSAA